MKWNHFKRPAPSSAPRRPKFLQPSALQARPRPFGLPCGRLPAFDALQSAMPALLDIADTIQRATASQPDRFGHAMNACDDIPSATATFLELLRERNIPIVIVGGIALLQHVPGRNTDDLDLIMSRASLGALPELEPTESNDLFATARFRNLRVDILFAEHGLFRLVAERFAAPLPFVGGSIPTATVEGLLLLKLFALPSLYQACDFDRVAIYEADLTQLLARSRRPDALFLDTLAPFLPGHDLEEISKLLTDIRTRLRRSTPPNPEP
jgi:hypothetical protein